MPKLIIANWKMNPDSPAAAKKLAKSSDVKNLVICPPFPFLLSVGEVLKKAKLGAQNLFWKDTGPYTGEVSWHQLKHCDVEYVIIGHSERRRYVGETDEMAAKKFAAAVETGLTPILCVGESKEERASGKTREVIKRELAIGLSSLKAKTYHLKPIVIAYEPVWAIGTGIADDPKDTIAIIRFMKEELLKFNYKCAVKFIYGGSVNSANADNFLKHKEIEGALVGGASLRSEEIKKIVETAKKYEN